MPDDDKQGSSFDDVLRAIAQEVKSSLDRVSEDDIESWTRKAGLDPETGVQWFQTARDWVQEQADGLVDHPAAAAPAPGPSSTPAADASDPRTAPHPLDLPTDEQGAALAALDSGRWALEPGTMALTVVGDGPGPTDALGLVRSLRVRDWLRADGTPTVAGLRALERWLATTA